ncbi:TetR family transcriptional regulator [Rhodococcus opacus]|uniref:TetR family transcriptional regulator n=1 Tax=Rhodococcus opacus TaxID=37919 RepID=UPI0024BBA387|nr:TetR family transcriptional regulator [Rhodococcus opacus]MDJ0419801.1 TetR family transcriptional regulator [Rhodococcus opacus]
MQRRAQLTRTTILARAAEQFDRHGYTHAALHEIAGVSHATKGGLYFHFRSKRTSPGRRLTSV